MQLTSTYCASCMRSYALILLALWSRGHSNSVVVFDVTPNEKIFSELFLVCSHKEHGYFHVPFLERIHKLNGIFHECVVVTSTWKFHKYLEISMCLTCTRYMDISMYFS